MTPQGKVLRTRWVTTIFLIAAIAVLPRFNAESAESQPRDTAPQKRIQQLEQFLNAHPDVFDWNVHNELRHLYITDAPPNLRKAMEHADSIFQHSTMDSYILQTLSDWQIDRNPSTARANLLAKVQPFPDLQFLAAACLLKIGDLYAMEGNFRMAKSSYLKVAVEISPAIAEYRVLAASRLDALKEQPGPAPQAVGVVGSYRGTATINAQGTKRVIPVTLNIESAFLGVFTGYITIETASIIIPIQGRDVRGHINASGSVPDRTVSISIHARHSGASITGTYRLDVSTYGKYNLNSRFPSGEFTVSR